MTAIPRATYRLQLNAGFTLDDAAAIVDYLHALGVSHVYTSPWLQAKRGSTHGYDVVDHGRVNCELGGEAALERLGARLAVHGMGMVVDVVPNHMAVDRDNAWWWDVLENGPSSRFAAFFDVDWEPPEARLRNLVLLPVLHDHYGRVLEARELQLVREGGSFRIRYREHEFPVAPRSQDELLRIAAGRCASQELAFLADAFERLPLATATDFASTTRRHRDKRVLRRALAGLLASRPDIAEAVDAVVAEWNADPDALHALLERQNWRIARWRAGERDLGYRRFFDVDHLVALRMEDPLVFDATHAALAALRERARIDGLRVDHVDGLRDPSRYLERLCDAWPGAWIVVEKVLEPDEPLPPWPVAGTTGYEFLNLVGGLFVDPAGEKVLSEFHQSFTGETRDFATVAREKKESVLRHGLGPDLGRLTVLALAACERHRRYRDFTRHELHEALRTCLIHFPVYRSYVRAGDDAVRGHDAQVIWRALLDARAARPDLDAAVFDFLAAILSRALRGDLEDEIVLRFQQLSGPTTAKGVEDSAFYAWNRLVSLNEVGGDPARFGTTVAEFHAANRARYESHPAAMLATSTHDTKRGEDARVRLHLLSEIPDHFARAVARWSDLLHPKRGGAKIDRAAEYAFYQMLIAAWPIDVERAAAYMEKAVREARERTSWTDPDERYEHALRAFVEAALGNRAFARDLDAFVAALVEPARIHSLAQVLCKLTCPGVPDIYQGCETWNASLVDPDNRRPVDFARLRRLLAALDAMSAREIWARADDGLPKLWLIQQALDLRRRRPESFGPEGDYEPLEARGQQARHVVAFLRGGSVAAIAPRLVLGLGREGGFGETTLALPSGTWRDVLSDRSFAGGAQRITDLIAAFPVALLERVAP